MPAMARGARFKGRVEHPKLLVESLELVVTPTMTGHNGQK